MLKKVYLIGRIFEENRGSYANYMEEAAKFFNEQGIETEILCGAKNGRPGMTDLKYATVRRFALPKKSIPILGMNTDYLSLARSVKKFFRDNPLKEGEIIVANSRASLGVPKGRYVLRAGQPAKTFLTNMELAGSESGIKTRTARFLHFSIQGMLESPCMKNAGAYLFPSMETRDEWFKYYGKNDRPVFIPFSGVSYSKLAGGKNILEGKNILFISAGDEKIRKGVMHLERALPEVFKKHPDAKLIHVGDKFPWDVPEEYRGNILSAGRVSWDKMKDYYASCGFMVSCALNEGFPNAVLESMAAGTPVVSSDINGIREYLTHGADGMIYKRGDIKELSECMDHMLERPLDAKRMGDAARERIRPLDYPSYMEKLISFLEDVTAAKKARNVNLLT